MSVDTGIGTGLREAVHAAARRARVAARTLASLTTVEKNRALHAASDAVLTHTHQILAANAADLDAARAANFNAVVFQARPCCDAMYKSSLEPWSEFLTGESGKAPLGDFDPLAEWVAAAHERGMELHAWVNPFRARHFDEKKPAAASHISRTRPELVKEYDRFQWLDPGEAEAQEHTFRVIADLLARYDLDGLHIDDYFYPYPKGTDPFPDGPSWDKYRSGGGPLARDDWRRDNINRFVKRLYETTKATKRPVKVGISPFGIWKPGYPAGVDGMDSTVKIFADAKLWLREGWMDYCSPQLYWKIDAPKQPFEPLLAWWSGENVRHRALWPWAAWFFPVLKAPIPPPRPCFQAGHPDGGRASR